MEYEIYVAYADGSKLIKIVDVTKVEISEKAYIFYGIDGNVIYSSPIDFTVYVNRLNKTKRRV